MSTATARKAIVAGEVLEQAARLFAQKGFAGTSLQDVAEAVGLSRPALYYYFKSKNALLEALIQDVTVNAAEALTAIRDDPALTGEQRLYRAVEAMVLWVLDRPTRFKVIDRAEADLPKPLADRHVAAKRKVLEAMSGLIERGMREGALRPADPRMSALCLIGMCNWTAWWYSPTSATSKAEVAAFVGEMALSALRRSPWNRPEGGSVDDAIDLLRRDLDYLELLTRRGADDDRG